MIVKRTPTIAATEILRELTRISGLCAKKNSAEQNLRLYEEFTFNFVRSLRFLDIDEKLKDELTKASRESARKLKHLIFKNTVKTFNEKVLLGILVEELIKRGASRKASITALAEQLKCSETKVRTSSETFRKSAFFTFGEENRTFVYQSSLMDIFKKMKQFQKFDFGNDNKNVWTYGLEEDGSMTFGLNSYNPFLFNSAENTDILISKKRAVQLAFARVFYDVLSGNTYGLEDEIE